MLCPDKGLIPAWAGKTKSVSCSGWVGTAHPRVGGENICELNYTQGRGGSSPRGRGKRKCFLHVLCVCGLIPAWAGKTGPGFPLPMTQAAHPRVGGENRRVRTMHTYDYGSSPRGRGKQPDVTQNTRCQRLIPAWAGKTGVRTVSDAEAGAHPRVGGENSHEPRRTLRERGSSPRGRGKLRAGFKALEISGLIPAWAGKTRDRPR